MTRKKKGVLYRPDGSTEEIDVDIDIDNPLANKTFDPVTRKLIDKSEITPEYLEKLAAKGRQYIDDGNDFLAEECFRFKEEYEAEYINKKNHETPFPF